MAAIGVVAIARYVIRNRQHIEALRCAPAQRADAVRAGIRRRAGVISPAFEDGRQRILRTRYTDATSEVARASVVTCRPGQGPRKPMSQDQSE
jgi:hypothetical protein